MRRRIVRVVLLVLGVLALAVVVRMASIHASNERAWIPEHARLPLVTFEGDQVLIEGVRNFRYVSADSFSVDYYDRTYDLDQIESLWFVLSIFAEDEFRGLAHSMFSFGFADGSYVGISVEARKEVGESYSLIRGALRKFELIYVIGDERDLVRTRAVGRPDHVHLYRIQTTPDKVRDLFVDMLESANALQESPQFYNTLTRNCTTVLRDHANHVAPGRIPPSWRILLPGYSDALLENLGLLDSELSVDEARERSRIDEKAALVADSPDFSALIRDE